MSDFRIQRGYVDFGASEDSVAINLDNTVDITKAFARITNSQSASSGPSVGTTGNRNVDDIGVVSITLSTTQVTIARLAAGENADYRFCWEVWEYIGAVGGPNEFIVRAKGNTTFAANNAESWLNSSTYDTYTKLVPICGALSSAGTGASWGSIRCGHDTFISGPTTYTRAKVAYQPTVVRYITQYCVEFTGSNWQVDTLSQSFSADGINLSKTMSYDVGDWTHSFIISSYRLEDQNLHNIADLSWCVSKGETSTTLSYRIPSQASDGYNRLIYFYILTNPTIKVTHLNSYLSGGEAVISSSSDASSTRDVTIPAVQSLDSSGIIANVASLNASTQYPDGFYDYRLTSTTNVEFRVGRATSGADFGLQVIDFDPLIAPVINSISNESAETGSSYIGPTPSLSVGNGTITWTLSAGPSGMTINSSTGVVSWSTPISSGSPFTITVTATNAAGADSETFYLTISEEGEEDQSVEKIINNIGLYLRSRKGFDTDYNLVLCIYESINGIPVYGSFPLAVASRTVNDIDHDGWYIFRFPNSVSLSSGTYCLVLNQLSNYMSSPIDMNVNFVEWVHSDYGEENENLFSFSNDSNFLGFTWGDEHLFNLYGYGYGYGYSDPMDYYDVMDVNGNNIGYAINQDFETYGYGYGFEEIEIRKCNSITRTFKIYETFNDISFIDETKSVKINLPAASTEELVLDNRQDFVKAVLQGTEIVGDTITLINPGGRLYSTDITTYNSVYNSDVSWDLSSVYLSNNDLNDLDIKNISGNSNPNRTWMVAAPYYSGAYFSDDSGSTWVQQIENLRLSDNTVRNFSSISLSPDCSYAIAFDNTNETEKGKVFKAILDSSSIEDEDISWEYVTRILDGSDGVLVNSVKIFDSTIVVGTDFGFYISYDDGETWSVENTGLPSDTEINQIFVLYDPLYYYGYGYGYGTGLDYFDVMSVPGSTYGYGTDDFEVNNSLSYAFGYGYEEIYGNGSPNKIYIATDKGLYVSDAYVISWSQLGVSRIGSSECYSVYADDDKILVGLSTSLLRSVDSGATFEGNNVVDDYYVTGLLRQRITGISSNNKNKNEIFISQYGGIFISDNSGADFSFISKNLPEKRIKKIINNPVNSRIIYASTETTKYSKSAITILMDCSGSMNANDPDNKRISMAKKIVKSIDDSATVTPNYYQVVKFGLSETGIDEDYGYEALRLLTGVVDIPGTEILTTSLYAYGFISDASSVYSDGGIIDLCVNDTDHRRTPLFDSLEVLSGGINKFGSSWNYSKELKKYVYNEISSDYFNELHKAVIIITDGQDSVNGKKSDYLSSISSQYKDMRSEVYIVGVGSNINYDNLKAIKEANPNTHLYLSTFGEELYRDASVYNDDNFPSGYLDIAEAILEYERYKTRIGYWNKIIDFSSNRIVSSISSLANVPESTTCLLRLRISEDKDSWGAWTDWLAVNEENIFNLFGRYLEIQIKITSNSASYAPEITEITIESLNPSDNYIYYNSMTESNKIDEFFINSLDDESLGNITNDEASIDFGFVSPSSTDFNYYNTIRRNKRSVVGRRVEEKLITDDGYFYTPENGSWSYNSEDIDSSAVVYYDSVKINEDMYYLVPQSGLVIFYDIQKETDGSYKDFTIKFPNDETYRVGINIKNYDDLESFSLHNVSWMYNCDENSQEIRSSLPYMISQLKGESYGKVSQEFYPSFPGLTSRYIIQYILKDGDFSDGYISLITGDIIDLSEDKDGSNKKYYSQNSFFEKYNISNPLSTSYTSAFHNGVSTRYSSSSLSTSLYSSEIIDNPEIHYQLNLNAGSLSMGDTIGFIIGDASLSNVSYGVTKGTPSWFKQENLLFSNEDDIYGELDISFLISDSDSVSNSNFDKKITPSIKLCGTTATKIVIVAPTTISNSEIFNFSVLAVDSMGLIDKTYTGEVELSFSPESFGSLNISNFKYKLSDEGVRVFSGYISFNSSGIGKIVAEIISSGETFESNRILVYNGDKNIKWGDFNVNTLFGDGRQNINWICDYAKDISRLDFIGITDDLDVLLEHDNSADEWNYIKRECESNTGDGLFVFAGFKHRSNLLYGERCIVFENFNNIPSVLPSSPKNIGDNPESQIQTLISDLEDDLSLYISIPIHSGYKYIKDTSEIYRGRGFYFENYRDMMNFSNTNSILNFIENDECVCEIYSDHGFCEKALTDGNTNDNFSGGNEEQYIQHALKIGKKFGFVAGSGGYSSRPGYYTGDQSLRTNSSKRPNIQSLNNIISNRGLTALAIDEINKTSIISSLRDKSCYATTGARIYLSFIATVGSDIAQMGETIYDLGYDVNGRPEEIASFAIRCISDKNYFKKIEIIRITVDKIIETAYSYNYSGLNTYDISLTFNDSGNSDSLSNRIVYHDDEGDEICYYIRVEQEDGHVAWSSPIWLNYGRTDGIRASNLSSLGISQPILTTLSSTDYTGLFSSVDSQNSPINNFSTSNLMPDNQLSLFTTSGVATPITRKSYNNYGLYISDNNPEVWGTRVLSGSSDTVLYGTHCVKFLYNSDEDLYFKLDYTNNDGPNDISSLKYLSDWGPYLSNTNLRSKMFGYLWQYSNNSKYIKNGYELESDNIFIQPGNNIPLIKDPYMVYSGGYYHLLYVLYNNSIYPESDSNLISDLPKNTDYQSGSSDPSDGRYGRIEDFVGLLETTPWNNSPVFKIVYTDSVGTSTERSFKSTYVEFPYQYDNGDFVQNIYYPSSPNLIIESSEYRNYYLGWFLGPNNETLCGLFCHVFNSLETLTGTTYLCFVFSDSESSYPSGYRNRISSLKSEDLIWVYFKNSLISNYVNNVTDWPELHPAYSIGFSWLSVVKSDDNVYYAFFNKNTSRNYGNTEESNGGTGILYSFDGLSFFEYDITKTKRISDLTNLYYVHPFKSQGKWFLSYRDSSDLYWSETLEFKVKYKSFIFDMIDNFSGRT